MTRYHKFTLLFSMFLINIVNAIQWVRYGPSTFGVYMPILVSITAVLIVVRIILGERAGR